MQRFVLSLITIAATAISPSVTLAQSFSMIGSWQGSPDCPIEFYRDNGRYVEGNCDNGAFNHIVRGKYADSRRINITTERIDPKGCSTTVTGYIQILSDNRVKYWQNGWNGCGVRTPPATQYWTRSNPPSPSISGIYRGVNVWGVLRVTNLNSGGNPLTFSADDNNENPYFKHLTTGTLVSVEAEELIWNISTRRTNTSNGCTTMMSGTLTQRSNNTARAVYTSTDGRCDLPINFSAVTELRKN